MINSRFTKRDPKSNIKDTVSQRHLLFSFVPMPFLTVNKKEVIKFSAEFLRLISLLGIEDTVGYIPHHFSFLFTHETPTLFWWPRAEHQGRNQGWSASTAPIVPLCQQLTLIWLHDSVLANEIWREVSRDRKWQRSYREKFYSLKIYTTQQKKFLFSPPSSLLQMSSYDGGYLELLLPFYNHNGKESTDLLNPPWNRRFQTCC